jgi:hypothetical protein
MNEPKSVARPEALPTCPTLLDSLQGGNPRDVSLVEILEQVWPDSYCCSVSHAVVMAPDDETRLEALFELFGVPLRIADNSLTVLGHAYDVFALGLSRVVNRKLRFPETFETYLEDWSQEWVQYIEAVAYQNLPEARRLASKLQVLAPECRYPPGVFVPESSARKPSS